MIIAQSELAKKIGVTKTTVSNWVNRDKKIVLNENKKIDTESELNRSFLRKKAPFLYTEVKKSESNDNLLIDLNDFDSENDNEYTKIDISESDIDNLSIEECREYLKIILYSKPKELLITAQYKKANIEYQLKNIDLKDKMNHYYSREEIDFHFVNMLKIYYQRSRNIGNNIVDDIINTAIAEGLKSRGKILSIIDKKFIFEVDEATKELEKIMCEKLPKGKIENIVE